MVSHSCLLKRGLSGFLLEDDIDKVIAAADEDTQDYLWAIRDTMARVSEINRLCWDDVDFDARFIVLHTRKKKGGI